MNEDVCLSLELVLEYLARNEIANGRKVSSVVIVFDDGGKQVFERGDGPPRTA